ncbi:MAG TPA: hypothetical protein VLF15_02420 [Pseudoxanthomonas sp.]|nr:hypothetical protein [Pseudoxanthomonas sp.]
MTTWVVTGIAALAAAGWAAPFLPQAASDIASITAQAARIPIPLNMDNPVIIVTPEFTGPA